MRPFPVVHCPSSVEQHAFLYHFHSTFTIVNSTFRPDVGR